MTTRKPQSPRLKAKPKNSFFVRASFSDSVGFFLPLRGPNTPHERHFGGCRVKVWGLAFGGKD